MIQALENLAVADGDPVRTEHIAAALTAGGFVYADGATQTFEPSGGTTYVEHAHRSRGEGAVDSEGRFCSFWPPSTVPVTISTGSWRTAASLVFDSPSSNADQFLLGATGDMTRRCGRGTISEGRSLWVNSLNSRRSVNDPLQRSWLKAQF